MVVLFSILMLCYCENNSDLSVEETRAKKKKGSAKLLGKSKSLYSVILLKINEMHISVIHQNATNNRHLMKLSYNILWIKSLVLILTLLHIIK